MNIYFRGEVGDNQSWGISTIGNIQGFLALGHKVTLDATNVYGNIPEEVKKCIGVKQAKYDVFIRQGLAKHMDELSHIDPRIVRISLSCWDSSLIDAHSAEIHNKYADGVLSLSTFTRQAFVDAGVKTPIHPGGIGYDEQMFFPIGIKHDDFTFLTVAVAQGRKGTHQLIRAFEKALGNQKGAKLIIKSNSWGNLKDYGTVKDNVIKIYKEYTRAELADLYKLSDCFVLPSEGDSFALPGTEAMGSGLPLIMTGFGGPCDYCTDKTGYRIKYTLKKAGYLPGHQAIPDEDHLAELLRYVFEHQDEAGAKGAYGAEWARVHWTWKKDAERIIDFFNFLLEQKRAQYGQKN